MNPQTINTPKLDAVSRGKLLRAISLVASGFEVRVSLTYPKQTKTRPRIAGEDYVALPGVTPQAQIGTITVHQYVNSTANRRKGFAGKFYLKIKTLTRGNGFEPGYANMRVEGLTAFEILAERKIQEAI